MPCAPDGGAVRWPAPAKLNLFLHVTGRRADGYHELQTLFQLIDLADDILPSGCARTAPSSATRGPPGCAPEAGSGRAGGPQRCSAAPAAPLGADIEVRKRIPLGGGLGGGSSDAATTLLALNELWGCGLAPRGPGRAWDCPWGRMSLFLFKVFRPGGRESGSG